MNRARLSLLCGLALTGGLFAQTATVPDDGLRISRDDPNGHPHDYTVSWERRLERTYFLQISEDLVTWFYFPDVIEHGVAGPVAHVISGLDTDRLYFRLLHTDEPYDVDFDHDKVSNLVETVLGTDPFAFADWDGDGMSDDWESLHGLDPHDPLDANDNPDGDALTNLEEYHNGPEGTDPHNYFNAGTPVLRAVGGTEQAGEPDAFSPQPLVLEVRIGAIPLEDCPIVVSTTDASAGQISLTNTGADLETILHLHTGGDGRVTVYFKHPAPPPAGGDAGRIIRAQIEVPVPSTLDPLQGYLFTTKVNFSYPPGTVGLSATEAIDNRLAASAAAMIDPETTWRRGRSVNVAVLLRRGDQI